MNLKEHVEKHYGGKLRVRVCGICIENNKLLLVKHEGLGPEGILWAPPGGGIEWGDSAAQNLVREFREECGLEVGVKDFLFLHEYAKPPLHALELFFLVELLGGTLKKGFDPEMKKDAQLIQHVSFMSWEEIITLPKPQLHQILQHSSSLQDLLSKRGYYNFSV